MSAPAFDFEAFKQAFVAQDIDEWIEFYADDAEWIEYNHHQPLNTPQRVSGRDEIYQHLRMIEDSRLTLAIEDELIGSQHAAFRVWVVLSSGKRIIEHTMIYYSDGKIQKMVDVEAWD